MIYSHKHKFIFIDSVKTGVINIEVILSKLCDIEHVIASICSIVEGHKPRYFKLLYNIKCQNTDRLRFILSNKNKKLLS